MTVQADIILAGLAGGFRDRFAFGDLDLGLNDINAGDFFSYSVFDLNAGVHLDEVELAGIHIHQEFDGARAFVIHMGTDLATQFTQALALGFGQVWGRGALDDLLVATLDRAIAFPQMIDRAMGIPEDLNLYVARPHDHLFQITLAIAEGGFCFAASLADFLFQFVLAHDRAHAASTAAPGGFQHQRIADFLSFSLDGFHILAQHLGCRDHRHARCNGNTPRAGFVPQGTHCFCLGSDESDAVGNTGVYKIGVFRKQTVAGMNGVCAAGFGDTDDLINAQIRRDRAQTFANLVGFISFEAVETKFVLFSINRNGFLAHFIGGTHDANGDFAAVCDKNF